MLHGAEVNLVRNPKIVFRFHEDGRDKELAINEARCIEKAVLEACANVGKMADTVDALLDKEIATIKERTGQIPSREQVRPFVIQRLVAEEAKQLGKETFADYIKQINEFFTQFHDNVK